MTILQTVHGDVEVVGPITGARPPFGVPRLDVSDRGYVVEEFLIMGTASAYAAADGAQHGVDGRWVLQPAGTADYVTRLLVIRPADAARFNGTVLVNWQNVSAGAEMRAPSVGELYDGGSAWVGVSAQEVGINGFPMGMDHRFGTQATPLKDHDPERYRPLLHPGDQGSFAIFHDAARVVGVERSTAVDPMARLSVERVVAVGGSQSAMRLVAYFNGLHAVDPVVDGVVLGVWEGRAPRYEEGSMPFGTMTRVRDDISTPVIVVNSEFEATALANIGAVDTDTFRIWEAAGTPHAPSPIRTDDGGWTSNPLVLTPLHEAALRAMQRWLTEATPPLHQPRIRVEPGRPARVPRDELGNAFGGIRLPELAAPLREYRGMAFGTGRPPLMGSSRALPSDVVDRRYPTQAAYAAQWRGAVDDLVTSGVLRAEDAKELHDRVPLLPSR
jgi:hypothetical protein